MAKKIFVAMMLAFAIVVAGGQPSTANAEVYVGNYSDGTAVYLVSVSIHSRNPYNFHCRVRDSNYIYLNYHFYPRGGSPYYRNNEGYEGYVFGGQSPVAANIYRYVINNY